QPSLVSCYSKRPLARTGRREHCNKYTQKNTEISTKLIQGEWNIYIICRVEQQKTMGFRIASIIRRASFSTTQAASKGVEIPKGYV
ncbi:hypothetical protein CR513_44024, partial [Mucuna pruriens]